MKNRKTMAKSLIRKLRPVLIIAILIPIVTFMYYPMANMSPRDLNIGIVNLDEGAAFDQGKVNVGDKIIKQITKSSRDTDTDSPVIWKQYDTKKAAAKAVRCGKIYAYLVIPGDFSSKQTSSLDALDTLGAALGNMSTGVTKMGTGVETMSSKFGNLPTAFSELSDVTGQLSQAAGNLGKLSGAVNSETGNISSSASTLKESQQDLSDSLNIADSALEKLQSDLNSGTGEETIAADIAALQTALNAAEGSNSNGKEQTDKVSKSASAISGQMSGMNQGLTGIQSANQNMSANFAAMSDKMSAVGPGIGKMSTALSTIGNGLETMSDNLDSKVGNAVDKINSTSDTDDSDSDTSAELDFYVDQSSNVLVSNTLSGMINGISAKTGMRVDTTYLNEVPEGTDTMYFIMAFMMLSLFCTMMPSILTGLTTRPKGFVSVNSRAKTIALQLIICILVACAVGFCVPRVIGWMCSLDTMNYTGLSLFIGIFCFGYITLTLGVFDIAGMAGIAVPVVIMICGTAVAVLPYEYLPAFWQNFIYPWEPLRFLTEGVREIVYRGVSWWNDCSQTLIWMTVIGLVLMLLSFIKSRRKIEAGD